ncbi:hypothetical protein L9F63_014741, partial [Diploptera punctata]
MKMGMICTSLVTDVMSIGGKTLLLPSVASENFNLFGFTLSISSILIEALSSSLRFLCVLLNLNKTVVSFSTLREFQNIFTKFHNSFTFFTFIHKFNIFY